MRGRMSKWVWPHVAVLACLFLLSLTAPRSWQRSQRQRQPQAATPARSGQLPPPVAWDAEATPARVVTVPAGPPAEPPRPDNVASLTFASAVVADLDQEVSPAKRSSFASNRPADLDIQWQPFASGPPPAGHQASAPSQPPAAALGERSRGPTGFDEPDAAPPDAAIPPPPLVVEEGPAWPERPEVDSPQQQRLALRPMRQSDGPAFRLPGILADDQPVELPSEEESVADWAVPTALVQQLGEMTDRPELAAWANDALAAIWQLTGPLSVSADETDEVFERLQTLIDAADRLEVRLADRALSTELRRARHAVARRLDVWRGVHVARSRAAADSPAPEGQPLNQSLAEIAVLTDRSARGQGWRDFLLFRQLLDLTRRSDPVAATDQQALARRILGRLTATRMTSRQQAFLHRDAFATLDLRLRYWAQAPVDLRALVVELERFEQTRSGAAARRVVEDYHRLAWSPQVESRQLAKQIERHYLNANLRADVSRELLNRMLPQPAATRQRVREQIAGADVWGRSEMTSRLFVRLIPDDVVVRLGLEASGTIVSDTIAAAGPARFSSRGRTSYEAIKLIQLTPYGPRVWPAIAEARGSSRLRDVDTDFDRLPLVGLLVRAVALSQHEKSLGEALREVENKVARIARRRLDQETERQLNQARIELKRRLMTPLAALSLKVTPIEMRTTAERIVVRARLAGSHQLGAHTPRPRAPADAFLSVELHESTLRNILEQLDLDGRTFTLPELYRSVATSLGQPNLTPPDDLARNAVVRFARQDAVQATFADGKVVIVLALAELSQRRHRYRNFRVRATYRAVADGIKLELARDGILRLEGKRFRTREQIVLRGVFAKLFPRTRPVRLIRAKLGRDRRFAGLEVTQLVVDEGWFAVALGRREG
ncbi:MAG: hypothetical protein BMS9Abin04_377 [Planctomycetia bacterium]|nr:MAG: hypothetical protein BMS9Abin04_377 [Planctomycetia bacterium]